MVRFTLRWPISAHLALLSRLALQNFSIRQDTLRCSHPAPREAPAVGVGRPRAAKLEAPKIVVQFAPERNMGEFLANGHARAPRREDAARPGVSGPIWSRWPAARRRSSLVFAKGYEEHLEKFRDAVGALPLADPHRPQDCVQVQYPRTGSLMAQLGAENMGKNRKHRLW